MLRVRDRVTYLRERAKAITHEAEQIAENTHGFACEGCKEDMVYVVGLKLVAAQQLKAAADAWEECAMTMNMLSENERREALICN